MNNQEALDAGYEFLQKQGRPSRSEDTCACHFRHPDNPELKCFVGVLIPDEVYKPNFECQPLFELHKLVPGLDGCDYAFLKKGQEIHDDFTTLENWEKEYKQLAVDWNLKWNF